MKKTRLIVPPLPRPLPPPPKKMKFIFYVNWLKAVPWAQRRDRGMTIPNNWIHITRKSGVCINNYNITYQRRFVPPYIIINSYRVGRQRTGQHLTWHGTFGEKSVRFQQYWVKYLAFLGCNRYHERLEWTPLIDRSNENSRDIAMHHAWYYDTTLFLLGHICRYNSRRTRAQ